MQQFFKEYGYFIQTATFKRVANLIALHLSFQIKKILKNKSISGKAYALSIEPTTACNLGCPECPSGLKKFTRKTGNISWELYEKIISENKNHLWYINLYFQGEPFIHPLFFNMVALANKHKIYTSTSTNAHFLDKERARKTVESGLNRLIISFDGTTQEIYEQYRKNGNLNTVLQGIKNITEAKSRANSKYPFIVLQFLVVKPNEHQIEDAKLLAKELKVDAIRFKTAQVYNYENGNPLIPNNEKYARYKKKKDGTYTIKNTYKNNCWRMWSSAVITQNGEVVPCCFDKDATYQFGNLDEQSFAEIWQSKPYHNFRKQVFTNRKAIDICRNCTEGTKVWT
jgi:radical SAM protein with 4Fe4S-binding SPASM domain